MNQWSHLTPDNSPDQTKKGINWYPPLLDEGTSSSGVRQNWQNSGMNFGLGERTEFYWCLGLTSQHYTGEGLTLFEMTLQPVMISPK